MDRSIERPRWKRSRLLGIGLAAVVAVFLAAAAAGSFGERRLRIDADRLQIVELATGVFEEYLPVSAEVIPVRTVFLDAVEGGRVERLFVEEGAFIRSREFLQVKYFNFSHLVIDGFESLFLRPS